MKRMNDARLAELAAYLPDGPYAAEIRELLAEVYRAREAEADYRLAIAEARAKFAKAYPVDIAAAGPWADKSGEKWNAMPRRRVKRKVNARNKS